MDLYEFYGGSTRFDMGMGILWKFDIVPTRLEGSYED